MALHASNHRKEQGRWWYDAKVRALLFQCLAVAAVIAQAVEIPPTIAPWRNGRVEARDASRLCAASRPESIAIGTPGPGWIPPPARYRPGRRERAPGRRKDALQPWVANP